MDVCMKTTNLSLPVAKMASDNNVLVDYRLD